MAESQPTPPADQPIVENEEEKKLKYLDFVQAAAVYVVVCCSTLYDFAKQNSGPLRPGVETVEGTVRTVLGPVYEKFHNVPSDLLEFVDRKPLCPLRGSRDMQVDSSITELDHHVPDLLKQLPGQAWAVAQRAPVVARELASEIQQVGFIDMASNIAKNAYDEYKPTATELYTKYEPIAEQYAVTAWRTLNGIPLFSQAAHIMVPTAAYWADKYNQAVAYTAERRYKVSFYLPLLPIQRIAKTFGPKNEPANGVSVPLS